MDNISPDSKIVMPDVSGLTKHIHYCKQLYCDETTHDLSSVTSINE